MDLCQPCFDELSRNFWHCDVCHEAFEDEANHLQRCGRCLQRPPQFDQVIAPYHYVQPMAHLITALKFGKQYKNSRLLAMLLAPYVCNIASPPECLVPVPLHPARLRERGFNQSLEIARDLSSLIGIPLNTGLCRRQKNTQQQSSLSASDRRKNLRQAFTVKPSALQHIVLIDDVMTTGSTVNELASAVKQSGVKRVDVWVCARA